MYTIALDSHHKLIRWRCVTHGAIDGYSRLILYLQCTTNNRASTVYGMFINATQSYGLPSRVRSDQGLENVLVARHMIDRRGVERRSMLTGSSTHNQRIERLWRDMHHSATVLYYRLFYFMEDQGLLEPMNERHLWALHYIYIPRINRTLSQFVQSWNHHCIRTAGHKSPHQLYTAGMLMLQNSAIESLDFDEQVDESYGVDPDGPTLSSVNDNIHIPESTFQVSDESMALLRSQINPLSPSDNYGIELYEQTIQFILSSL